MTQSVSSLSRQKAVLLSVAMLLVFEGKPFSADTLLNRCVSSGMLDAKFVAKYSGAIFKQLSAAKAIEKAGFVPSERNDASIILLWRPTALKEGGEMKATSNA